jgi:hypothetical protein
MGERFLRLSCTRSPHVALLRCVDSRLLILELLHPLSKTDW